jgi:2-keto-4-pentenoate hydratase/2-oxohepta-3-ene-1,7-dioic acid hydratase in catechol pathway
VQLVTFTDASDQPRVGVHRAGQIVDIGLLANERGVALPETVLGFMEAGPDAINQTQALIENATLTRPYARPVSEVRLLAPIPRPPKILGLAGNFVAHIVEGGDKPRPKEGATPDVFMMPSSSVIGPGATIEIPVVSDAVDYELELAVIVGKRAKNVSTEDAMAYVGGYAVFNDISARRMIYPNRTENTGRDNWFDWLNGKWCDTFAAWGPYLVTVDEIAEPHELAMELRVNGNVRQSATTEQMIFEIPETIAFLSAIFTLEPGDVIAMGTPSGVGAATETYLQPGDVIEGMITGLGTLINPVGQHGSAA